MHLVQADEGDVNPLRQCHLYSTENILTSLCRYAARSSQANHARNVLHEDPNALFQMTTDDKSEGQVIANLIHAI